MSTTPISSTRCLDLVPVSASSHPGWPSRGVPTVLRIPGCLDQGLVAREESSLVTQTVLGPS